MSIKYNVMKHNDRLLWWRVIGHRGGRTYEISEPVERPGQGRAIVRRNIGFWVVDEKKLLRELARQL